MQQKFISKPQGYIDQFDMRQEKRLIMFFTGWGMDELPFNSLFKPGYDILLVYDYSDDSIDISRLRHYDEICVLAWSLGVWHADRFISANPQLPFTRCIAVNGTLNPVDDNEGIPERIYDLTSALPNTVALQKFYRRICGSQSAMEQLMPVLPKREIDDLRNELVVIRQRLKDCHTTDTSRWDEIYLSDSDLIFPLQNMKKGWESARDRVKIMPGKHHAIDFADFIDKSFVDKNYVGYRFLTASDTYNDEAIVQHEVATAMMKILAEYINNSRKSYRILEIGSGMGALTSKYDNEVALCYVDLWDLSPVQSYISQHANTFQATACDAEINFRELCDDSYDIILSASTLQWFNSPRRFIAEIPRILRPGGVAILSFYIDGTIPELNECDDIPRMHYPKVDDILQSLTGVKYYTHTEEFKERFSSPAFALAHLRDTGVNALNRTSMPVAQTRRLMNLLSNRGYFSELVYNTQFIVIKKHG